MIGRYPDYDVLDAADTWDAATRKIVLARARAARSAALLHRRRRSRRCARSATSCSPRTREPRIPVAEMVDAKLADGRLDGYRYADMPRRPRHLAAWCCAGSTTPRGRRYAVPASPSAAAEQREDVVGEFADGRLVGGPWEELNVDAGVVGGDARRAGRVLLPPVGVERDRLRRPRLPARLHAPGRAGPPGPSGREPFETPGRDRDADAARRGRADGHLLARRAQGRGRPARQRLPLPARRALAGTCPARPRCAATPTTTRSTW